MILSYSKEKFKSLILTREKHHSIREDEWKRWKPDMKIHQWFRNPRLKGKVTPDPHQFGEDTCKGVEEITIVRTGDMDHQLSVNVGGKELTLLEITKLAKNDGFEGLKDFRLWFIPKKSPRYIGRIIHWTDLRYGSQTVEVSLQDDIEITDELNVD
jgi:hypothetical protein